LHYKALSMQDQQQAEASFQAIREIRGIMERSSRFLSLSGWSGVWAGGTALVSAVIAWKMNCSFFLRSDLRNAQFHSITIQLIILALITFLVAFGGAYYFTWRKAVSNGQKMWTRASRQLMWQVAIPVIAGGIFCLAFLIADDLEFIPPACLAFYGMALINGSKYTLGEVRWLGYSELLLGCIALFVPYFGLVFLTLGFGVLHILYGIIMWNKYDNGQAA